MSSSSKTPRLKLNIWSPEDSPLRTDFNSDNELVDAAVQSLEASLASARAELAELIAGSSSELLAYARETRRLALDAYATALSAEVSALEPGASDAWVEDFADLDELDLTSPATTALCLMTDADDESINYLAASAGHHPSLGDTYSRASDANIALPFTLAESARIDRLLARPVYYASFEGDLNITCTVYRATASGGTYKLGEQVFTVTKERPTDLPYNATFIDDYFNFVDTPFTLDAGTYCVVFHGTDIRANNYNNDTDEGNPRLAPYDKLYTLPGGDPSAALTVTANRYADAAVLWSPTAAPYGILDTKLLGFDRAMQSAAVYVYCDTDDLDCICSVLGADGNGGALTPDADMRGAPVPNGLYVSKLSGTLDTPLTDAKLRLGLHSPSAGRIKRILFIAMRTEA